MTNPYRDIGRGAGGGSASNPYAQIGRTGGGTAKKKGGGSFFGNLVGDPIHAAVGSILLPYNVTKATATDVRSIAHGRAPTALYHQGAGIVQGLGQDPFVKDIRYGVTHPGWHLSDQSKHKSAVVSDVKAGHLFVPALDVLAVGSFGGARAGALGMVAERAPGVTASQATRTAILRGRHSGPLETITVRDTATGATIPTRTLPRNVYQAGRMRLTDKLLKQLPRSTPLLGESSRAARAVTRESQPVLLRHLADERLSTYQRAFSKLSQNERITLGVLARVPLADDLEGWKRILEGQDGAPADRLLETLSDPEVLKLYSDPSSAKKNRLERAHKAAVDVVAAREQILSRVGELSPEAAAAAVYAPTRIARGATFGFPVGPVHEATPVGSTVRIAGRKAEAKLIEVRNGNALIFYPRYSRTANLPLNRLESVGATVTERPRTVKEGQAYLDALNKSREKTIEDMREGLFGPAIMSEVRYRNQQNAKAAQQASGKTKSGRASGASGRKAMKRPDVLAEQRARTEDVIRQQFEADPDNPTLKAWMQREALIDQLNAALHPELFEQVDVSQLGKVAEPAVQKKPSLQGGGTPEQIAAEIAAAGRPKPFYIPDTPAAAPKTRTRLGSRETGGLTPPTSDVKGSQGILFRTGQLALHPDLLTPAFLRAARLDYRMEKHAQVKRIATPVEVGAGLPAGMRWVREIRGETIPFTETTKGEHLAELDRVLPGEKGLTVKKAESDATDFLDDEIATDEKGRRLAVTEQLARGLEDEYRQVGRTLRWFVQKPTDVWRALVLNLRIPWLINNIVGNNLLFALRFAGTDGLKAYAGLLSEPVRRKLLKLPATRRHLTAEDVAEIFPEQQRGTFIETQTPNALGTGKIRKLVRTAGIGLAPLDRRTEQALRRASLETVLRGSPEVKALYKAMPKQTRTLRAAMTRAASENPNLRRLANTEANRALGDYLSLNQTERGAVRRLVPFYGWYREIARIAAHAVVDTPVRVALLSNLAILEEERQQDKRGPFPTFLEGSVALGEGPQGTRRILNLRPANPFGTVADEARIAQFILSGGGGRAGASAALDTLNPIAMGAAEYTFAKAQGRPTDLGYQGGIAKELGQHVGPFGAIAGSMFGGLPYFRAISPPPPSRLYPTRDRYELLLQLLGDYRRNVNLQQAHLYAEQGK